MELSATSNNTLTTGRNALQKKILSLLRKIEHPTQGNKQAWYDTFVYQQTLTKLLYNYPKTASNKSGSLSDSKNDECNQEGSQACGTPVNLLHHHNRHSHNKRMRNGNNVGGSSSSMSSSAITASSNSTMNSTVGGGNSLVMSTSNYSNLGSSFGGSSNVTSLNMSSSSVNTTLNSSSLSGMIYSQEHDLEDILAEWANMTGFLSALGSVWLPCKQVAGGGKQDVGMVGREASSYLFMGRAHNTSMVSEAVDYGLLRLN